jgi:pentatricopeptide repeat protein
MVSKLCSYNSSEECIALLDEMSKSGTPKSMIVRNAIRFYYKHKYKKQNEQPQ